MWPFKRKQQHAHVPVLTTSIPMTPAPVPVHQSVAKAAPAVAPQMPSVVQAPSHAIDVRAEAIKSVIAAGEFLEGNLHFQHGVKIDGRVQGNVNFGIKDGLFVLNEGGQVEGNITGPRAIIVGEVFGNIVVDGKLIILPKAKIHGDIAAGTLQIIEGSTINGRICTVSEFDRLKTLEHNSAQQQQIAEQDVSAPPSDHAEVLRFSVGRSGR